MKNAVFVTGSTGFIGQALTRRLAQKGQKIIVPLRSCDFPVGIRKKRVESFQSTIQEFGALITPLTHKSLLQRDALQKMSEELKGCDVIFHLGGWVDHKVSEENLSRAFALNVLWTMALALLAEENGIRRFVFTSSRSVFDFIPRPTSAPPVVNEKTPISLPLEIAEWKDAAILAFSDYLREFLSGKTSLDPEDFCGEYAVKNPLDALAGNLRYSMTKIMGEEIVGDLWSRGVEGVNLRLQPVFGPSPVDYDSRTIPRTVQRLIANRVETAWPVSCGYLYLEDLLYALELLALPDGNFELPFGTKLILLGQHRQTVSQFELYKQIAAMMNPDFRIELNEKEAVRADEVYDASLSMFLFGLRYTPFSCALRRTVESIVAK